MPDYQIGLASLMSVMAALMADWLRRAMPTEVKICPHCCLLGCHSSQCLERRVAPQQRVPLWTKEVCKWALMAVVVVVAVVADFYLQPGCRVMRPAVAMPSPAVSC